MCRVRNAHTAAPWTTAYVCITIDESCLGEDGRYIDKPMTVRMVQWQPYCVMKPFDSKTPVCAACKRTNRTRSFCRERHKHRALPWCSVYVLLSALDAADPSTVVAGASTKVEEGEYTTAKHENGAGEESSPGGDDSSKATDTNSAAGDTIASDGDPGDDIHDIAESRTFLAKVSCRSTSIHWLELEEYDPAEAAAATFPSIPVEPQFHMQMGIPPHAMDPNQPPPQYYQQNMNFAQQQHQNALKSRQQYFFQMQQQQLQQTSPASLPPGVQPGAWGAAPPPPYHMGPPGQGEQGAEGGAAGDAEAGNNPASPGDDAQQQAPQLHLHHPVQHHWAAMYYQPPPPHLAYVATPPQHEANGQDHHQGQLKTEGIEPAEGAENERFHAPAEHEPVGGDSNNNNNESEKNEEEDQKEPNESKRQRVV